MMSLLKPSWAFARRRRAIAAWRRGWSSGPRLVAPRALTGPGTLQVHPMARRGPGDLGPARHVLAQVPAGPALLDSPLPMKEDA